MLSGSRDQQLAPDPGEFRSVRWWTPREVAEAEPGRVEPNLGRMLAKVVTLEATAPA